MEPFDEDTEADLLARAYEIILSWPENPKALDRAADEAGELALKAREAAAGGDRKRAEELRGDLDSLWDSIEAALDE